MIFIDNQRDNGITATLSNFLKMHSNFIEQRGAKIDQ